MKKLLSTTLCICITAIYMVQFMVTPSARSSGDFEYKLVLTCSDLSCAVADIPIPENVKVIATRNV